MLLHCFTQEFKITMIKVVIIHIIIGFLIFDIGVYSLEFNNNGNNPAKFLKDICLNVCSC